MLMELGGRDLQEELLETPFNSVEAKTGLRQLFQALDYLHSLGISHRDIKPANIIVKSRNPLCLKFTDFGMASKSEDLKTFVGTPRYIAPELDQKGSRYSNKLDIWSLGILALEFFYGLPDYPRHNGKINPEWYIEIESHLASQQPRDGTWQFIHNLLQVNPQLRPSAKESLEHVFFAGPSEPIALSGGVILKGPTQTFDPPQHHTEPSFDNTSDVSTIKGSQFHTAPQSPHAQVPSSEASTIHSEPGHYTQDVPSPSHHERCFRIPSSSVSSDSSSDSSIDSSSGEENDSGRLLYHKNPLRNTLHVGSFVAKMGREKLPTVTEREEEDSELPAYPTAQLNSTGDVTRETSLLAKLDDDGRSINRWDNPTFPGSKYNNGSIIESSHNISHPATIDSSTSETEEYDMDADDNDETIVRPPTTASPDRRFESTSSIATRDLHGFYPELREDDSVVYAPTPGTLEDSHTPSPSPEQYDFISTMNDGPGNSIEHQGEDSSVVYAPTPGALDDLDTISIHSRSNSVDPDTLSIESRSNSVVYAVIGHQRVSMRTSDYYLNAREICAAAGLDPRRSRKYLLLYKDRTTSSSSTELEDIWVPFSDGVSLSCSLNINDDLEELFLRASAPSPGTILPSIEADDEPPQSVFHTRGGRSNKRKRIG